MCGTPTPVPLTFNQSYRAVRGQLKGRVNCTLVHLGAFGRQKLMQLDVFWSSSAFVCPSRSGCSRWQYRSVVGDLSSQRWCVIDAVESTNGPRGMACIKVKLLLRWSDAASLFFVFPLICTRLVYVF